MSANNQIIVAPLPENLEKYAVWEDGCVDNPFNFSAKPLAVFDTLEEAISRADDECQDNPPVEYGVTVILRSKISGYEELAWDEFPEHKYLGVKYIPRVKVGSLRND